LDLCLIGFEFTWVIFIIFGVHWADVMMRLDARGDVDGWVVQLCQRDLDFVRYLLVGIFWCPRDLEFTWVMFIIFGIRWVDVMMWLQWVDVSISVDARVDAGVFGTIWS
jgi:hypothetical protein